MISVRRFMQRFPDEQACRDYLHKIRWTRGFICTKCGEHKHSHIRTRNLFECSHCRTQTSITSGTVMHRTKLPLRYWLLVHYWVGSGEKCSARKISKQLKVQYKTALHLLHTVREAMYRNNEHPSHAFWNPFKPDEDEVLIRAKTNMLHRARKFIRRAYRHCSERYTTLYYHEYWFRVVHSANPEAAINKLIKSAASTIWTRNEYRIPNSH
jgi:hypothetical protein